MALISVVGGKFVTSFGISHMLKGKSRKILNKNYQYLLYKMTDPPPAPPLPAACPGKSLVNFAT